MKALLIRIRILLRSRRNRQLLTRAVSVVAAIVVFVTTYALVLPAITLEQEAYCGILEHQHTDTCYEERLVCEIPEGEDHHHDASCYEKVLVCGQEVHIHSPECYQEDSIAVVSVGSETAAFTDFGTSAEADEIFTEADQTSAEPDGTFPEADQTFMDSDPFSGDGSDYDADTVAADSYAAADEAEDGMEGSSQETVPDDFGNSSDLPEDMDQENPAGAGGFELTEDSSQNTADSDMEAIETGSSEDTDAGTVDADSMDAEDSEAPGIEAPENMGDEQVSGIETSENMEADTADQEEAESQNIEEDKDAASDEEGGSQGESVIDGNENQFTESENSSDVSSDVNDWSDSAADTSDPAPEEDISDEDGESNESNDFAADTADAGLEDADTAVWETEDAGSADIAAEDADIAAGETEDAGSADIATEDADTVAGETEDAGSSDTETADADTAAGLEETANEAATDAPAEPVEAEKLSSGYVPQLDSIEFGSVLNKHTDFYYFHAEEGQEIPATSAEVTDWKKVKNGLFGSTKLETDDLVKAYFSYTIPAGALNETNQVARYRLPSNIHLTDDQIIAINGTENGMTAIYADAANTTDAVADADEDTVVDTDDENLGESPEMETGAEDDSTNLGDDGTNVEDANIGAEDAGSVSGTDEDDKAEAVPDTENPENGSPEDAGFVTDMDEQDVTEDASDSMEPAQDDNTANYQKYLGAEAVEGSRTPDEKLKEGAQEYISAIVKVENVFDEEGLYGEKGAYLGQDLIFIFTPYSIEKNQTTYDADGNPISAGEKITGWFACDFNMSQIDWVEEDTDLDKSTVEKTAEVVFVEKDSEKNVKEISRTLKLADKTGDQSDAAEGGETAAAAETAAPAETTDVAETAATAEAASDNAATVATAAETAGTDEAAKETEAGPFKSGTLTADGDGYRITLDYTEDAKIPENAELSVREITAETDKEAYEACLEQAGQQVATDDKTSVDQKASRFFDIEILVRDTGTDSDGKEETRKIEPAAPVSVNIQIIDAPAAEDAAPGDEKTERNEPAVLHFAEEGVEQLDSTVKASQEKDDEEVRSESEETGPATEISFEAESFSIYGVVYTVDFHWDVNGKTYEFSIPGGGFVSLEHLVEVLGIGASDNNTENETKEADPAAENTEATEVTEEDAQSSKEGPVAYDEAIKLNEVEVNEATRKFVADVESVKFSSPELAWVGKVKEEATVGGLKDANRLEVEYSAELTEEQIAEINAQTVNAGDWALISVQPFTSEETLTVAMTDGEQFTVKVTDGQISTHVITAAGEDFTITVIYGPESEIPSNAVLEASEIVGESDEFEKYLNQTREALKNRDTLDEENPVADDANLTDEQEDTLPSDDERAEWDGSIVDCTVSDYSSFSFARFFDIRIMVGEDIIEPKAPVTVKITYTDAVDVEEGEELLAIHFAEKGTEVIPIQVNQESRELTFRQDSFSVTGTVVPVGGNAWPSNNGSYVLFTQIGEQYYAIKHDGELVPVTCTGNQLSFENADSLFNSMIDYLWEYEHTRNYVFGQGYVDEDRLLFSVGENRVCLNPAFESGINGNRTLTRINNRVKAYKGNYYITVDEDNSHIAGLGDEENAIPIYFANGFDNINRVIIHFVDRDGNPIEGVAYNGDNSNVVANPDGDGTFAIPYDWNGATGVVDLSEDFSKKGYTYASTHLSGVQGDTTLRQDGLTIDAKLTERQNGHLYIGADIGSNKDYLSYASDATDSSSNINGEWIENFSGQRRLDKTIRAATTANARQDYATTTDKDIYVILDPAPNTISGGDDPTDIDADDPRFTKTLEDNGDGTYTLSLTIEGHAKSVNRSTNANVLFVVDTSSSMDNKVGNSNDTRIKITHDALKNLGDDLMAYNQKIENRVQVSMLAFDGSVYNRLEWTSDQSEFEDAVDTYINSNKLHRGTDWEDALKEALTQAGTADSDPTFVIFFTDGEPSQYSNYHGANTYNNNTVTNGYKFYFNSFLSRESCNDEARALVDSGYELYGIFAFNNSGHTYPNGATGDESDSDLLHNLLKYGYNTNQNLGANSSDQRFFPANNQDDLEEAFDKILEIINISVGFNQVEVTDNITDLTQAGFATSFDSVNDFSYYRSGNGHGTEAEPWEVWENAPQATPDVQNNSVTWALKNPDNTPMVLEDGVSYKVSFTVWPKQASFDWVANLQNGTKTWQNVVDAGLDFPNGADPQIVRKQTGTDENNEPVYSYSIATNKPSKNGNGEIINNGISYRKIRTEILNTLPTGVAYDTPETTYDENGNQVITTYTLNNGVITKTVVTTKTTCFDPPEPMPLNDTSMKVKKEWEDSINLGHRANYINFNLLVDGQPYMDKTTAGGDEKEYELKVADPDWLNEVMVAPGVIKDGDVLEEGHSYTISEEYEASGADFYGFSFEFKSQTVRPMNIDGELVYLVQIDDDNPAPSGAAIHAISGRKYYADAGDAGQKYYEAEKDSTGKATLSGTNGKTSELDITKIINKGNTNLTENDLDAESFTYRITLDIPEGSNINGIMGYCYFEYPDRPGGGQFKLFGYQPGETALASDIARFGSEDDSKKIYRSWNTTNERIKSQLMKTNEDGSITIKMDLTLTRKEVLRLTNLPSGTSYKIEEVYANYYPPASPSHSEEGQIPLDGLNGRNNVPSNLNEQGYSVTQILEKNSKQTEDQKVPHPNTTVISGTISETNTRYYNQFTNALTNLALGELKVIKHLEGYEWSGEKYYFNLTAGTATYSDGVTPATGVSPMPLSNRIELSNEAGTADKTETFGKIRYLRPGSYQYTIAETDADGNVLSGTIGTNNIAYAPAVTVTVTVNYDNDGHLVVQKIEGPDGNTVWSTSGTSAVVTGTTTFTNRFVVSVPIKKMDVDKQTQLSNAAFELMCDHSKLYFDSSNRVLTAAQVEAIIGMNISADGAAVVMEREGITSTFTIGEITLNGLLLNTAYTLKEIQPPDGYIITANVTTFELSKDDEDIKIIVTGENASVDEDGLTIIITNTPGVSLPSTGGPGTNMIYLLGIALIGLAGASLTLRSRGKAT